MTDNHLVIILKKDRIDFRKGNFYGGDPAPSEAEKLKVLGYLVDSFRPASIEWIDETGFYHTSNV